MSTTTQPQAPEGVALTHHHATNVLYALLEHVTDWYEAVADGRMNLSNNEVEDLACRARTLMHFADELARALLTTEVAHDRTAWRSQEAPTPAP